MAAAEPRDDSSDTSVLRALRILKCFTGQEPHLTLTGIARRTEMHKSTASRILAQLQREGFVERVPTGGFRLGMAIVELAGVLLSDITLRQLSQPYLRDLATASGESVSLAIWDHEESINVDFIPSKEMIQPLSYVGRRGPCHATALGKVLLAAQPPPTMDRLLSRPLPALTCRTITDGTRLRAEMEEVNARGFATSLEEFVEGLVAVAAPVKDANGCVVAAISISAPAFRVSAERLPLLANMVVDCAGRVSGQLVMSGDSLKIG